MFTFVLNASYLVQGTSYKYKVSLPLYIVRGYIVQGTRYIVQGTYYIVIYIYIYTCAQVNL